MPTLRFAHLVLFALALGSTACASIPLSTAWRLSNVTPDTFAQVDPLAVRVKVSVPDGFELDLASAELKVSVAGESGPPVTQQLGLRHLQTLSEARSTGFLSTGVPVTTYLFALDDEGAGHLADVQHRLQAGTAGSLALEVESRFAKTPPDPREVTFWIDLKLAPDAAFFPLVDGATMAFEYKDPG